MSHKDVGMHDFKLIRTFEIIIEWNCELQKKNEKIHDVGFGFV